MGNIPLLFSFYQRVDSQEWQSSMFCRSWELRKSNPRMSCLSFYRNIDHPSKKTQWYTSSYLACFLRLGTFTQLSITQGHVGKKNGATLGKWLGYSLPPHTPPSIQGPILCGLQQKSCVTTCHVTPSFIDPMTKKKSKAKAKAGRGANIFSRGGPPGSHNTYKCLYTWVTGVITQLKQGLFHSILSLGATRPTLLWGMICDFTPLPERFLLQELRAGSA